MEAIFRDVPRNYSRDFGQCFHESDHRTRAEGLQYETRLSGGLGSHPGASSKRFGIAAHHSVIGAWVTENLAAEQVWSEHDKR